RAICSKNNRAAAAIRVAHRERVNARGVLSFGLPFGQKRFVRRASVTAPLSAPMHCAPLPFFCALPAWPEFPGPDATPPTILHASALP
ncbi:MAG: hypothetical protein KJZ78_11375, partial [Bryobacteraceae bacterium]|nr:hypothetical protein [Bryobacteraceae bacterium]